MKAQFQAMQARFDAFSKRERALLAAALVGGIALLGNALLIDPNFSRARTSYRLGEQQKNEAEGLATQLSALKAQLQVDPDAAKKAEIERLKGELSSIEGRLRQLEGSLVPPDRMNVLLEQLLSSHARVRLVSLKSLAPVNLAETGKSESSAAASAGAKNTEPSGTAPDAIGLYRHGVEIRLEGSYVELYGWLAQLESAQQKLLWGDARFSVIEYPRSTLTLTVYTLSTDKAWLAI